MIQTNLAMNNINRRRTVFSPNTGLGSGGLPALNDNEAIEALHDPNYKFHIVGWDVDTQRDFMENGKNPLNYVGKLAIKDAMLIAPKLEELTTYLRKAKVPLLGSRDWHNNSSAEFSENPNFQTTFPEHCVANTYGAESIDATKPVNPLNVDWDYEYSVPLLVDNIRNHQGEILFRKDAFNVFQNDEEGIGNPYAARVLQALDVKKAIVYGVALEVCDDFAVKGLQDLGIQVYAVEDCMKAINEEVRPQILKKWEEAGAKIVRLEEVLKGGIL